jgi:hypothetical protein
MANCPDAVLRLIEHFDHQADQVRDEIRIVAEATP